MAIDYGTARGQLRLLIADTNETNPILEDGQVAGFLALNGVTDATATTVPAATIKRAAADALDAIATSEALLSKKIRTQAGVSTDGPAVAAALRAHAQHLRTQADQADDTDADVTILEFTPYPWPVY